MTARSAAITACGNCGQPEDAHKWQSGSDTGELDIFAALGGACQSYVASDAAIIYQKHLAITDHRQPQYQPRTGRIGKRSAICKRCGHRGHARENCPL